MSNINLLDTNEFQFTLSEAANVSGLSEKSLRNWVHREVVNVGGMHRTGRRLYSVLDIIELKVMAELTNAVAMPPTNAASLARYARDRCLEMSLRDESGELLYKGQKEENRKYLIAWFDGKDHLADVVLLENHFGNHSIPNAVVVVPLDDLVLRVMNMCLDILEQDSEE
jgi:hypothetical protein